MFDKSKENKFKSKNPEVIKALRELDYAADDMEKAKCTATDNVSASIKASFQFIKDNPILVGGKPTFATILMKVFLLKDESLVDLNFNYATTEILGVVKEVCDNYVVLTFKNNTNNEFEINIIYEDIVYFYHPTIEKNLQAYVNYINSTVPPLCREKANESYDLLVKIAKIIGRNNPNERDFTFIIDRILTRKIKAQDVGILRNLLILEDLFILPITSTQGFIQNGACKN